MMAGMNVIHNEARKGINELSTLETPEFMFCEIDGKGKEKIKISPSGLLEFCQSNGFCRFGDHIIHLVGGVAEIVDNSSVFQYCLAHVREFERKELTSTFILGGESLLIKNKGVLLGLRECQQSPIRDDRQTVYLFYRNGVVKIGRESGTELLAYEQIKGFVWRDSIKGRDFELLPDNETEAAQFYSFIQNTCNSPEHVKSTLTGLGYLIHGYKDPTVPRAVIINDENLEDNGKPEGGTGKGLYVKAIREMIQMAPYNGKNSDFGNNRFAYQGVNPTTRAVFIDDVNKNFPFEDLFSSITDDLVIERKRRDVEVVPYKDSPKFIITTNYTIRGRSSSFNRRRFDIFLNGHYGSHHRPIDDFGVEFFHGWDELEWKRFDAFMVSCVVQYLVFGLLEHRSEELEVKMLKHETSHKFWDIMEEQFSNPGERYYQWKIKEEVVKAHPGKWVQQNIDTMLAEWIKLYANHKGFNIKKSNYNGIYYEFSVQ